MSQNFDFFFQHLCSRLLCEKKFLGFFQFVWTNKSNCRVSRHDRDKKLKIRWWILQCLNILQPEVTQKTDDSLTDQISKPHQLSKILLRNRETVDPIVILVWKHCETASALQSDLRAKWPLAQFRSRRQTSVSPNNCVHIVVDKIPRCYRFRRGTLPGQVDEQN